MWKISKEAVGSGRELTIACLSHHPHQIGPGRLHNLLLLHGCHPSCPAAGQRSRQRSRSLVFGHHRRSRCCRRTLVLGHDQKSRRSRRRRQSPVLVLDHGRKSHSCPSLDRRSRHHHDHRDLRSCLSLGCRCSCLLSCCCRSHYE